jgi:L-threonylcarbamoyladenylate synthase
MEAGGIVGLPTETVYGLAVVPNAASLKAVIDAKGRPQEKGIAVLIDGIDQVAGLVTLPGRALRLAERFWPGPLTLVLPLCRPGSLPEALTGGRGTLGVRLPDHAVPRALARQLGPIAVTSANRSGEPEARTAAALIEAVGASLVLVLDDGPVRGGVASTVVGFGAGGRAIVLREGALGRSAVDAALAEGG